MNPQLDLSRVHQHHDPDPAFVADLERRLEAILAGDPAPVARVSLDPDSPHPVMRPAPRRWMLRGALGTAAALVAVVVAGVVTLRDDRQDIVPEATVAESPTTAAPPPAGVELPANGWVAQTYGGLFLWRDGEDHLVQNVAGSEVCPAFSPDGDRLLFGNGDPAVGEVTEAELVVMSVESDGSTELLQSIPIDGIDGVPCAIWAPDGRWVAFGGAGALWVVDTETTEVRRLDGYNPRDLEWRPGTDELAITGLATGDTSPDPSASRAGFVGANAPIKIYSVSTGDVRTIGDVEANQLTWSPDGSTIAYTQAVSGETNVMSGITLIGADGTNERPLTTESYMADRGIGVVWSPRGDQIAYQRERAECDPADRCNERSEVVLVTATDTDPANPIGTERVVPPIVWLPRYSDLFNHGPDAEPWWVSSVTWSPDGTQLLYSAAGQGLIAVPVDPDQPPIVLSGDMLAGQYDDRSTSPWIPLQQWQPLIAAPDLADS